MIEFQYYEGCPNAMECLDNLREVQRDLNIDENEISIVRMDVREQGDKISFQGSPSILIDGVDIYTGVKFSGYSFTCRVYNFDGIQTGVIPSVFIKNKLLGYKGNI